MDEKKEDDERKQNRLGGWVVEKKSSRVESFGGVKLVGGAER